MARLNNILSYTKGNTKIKLLNYYNKDHILYEGTVNNYFQSDISDKLDDKFAFTTWIEDNTLIIMIANGDKDELVDLIDNIKDKMEYLTEQLDEFVLKYK
jgi:hypothetical protein